jgi:predicted RNA-binding Zn-ribbon protein involved in translation (DUF1610 family)
MPKMIIQVRNFIFPIPLVVFVVGILLADYNNLLAAFLMVSGLALYALFYISLRCPVCGKSPYVRRMKERSSAWVYSLPLAEKQCSQCGLDFEGSGIENQGELR